MDVLKKLIPDNIVAIKSQHDAAGLNSGFL